MHVCSPNNILLMVKFHPLIGRANPQDGRLGFRGHIIKSHTLPSNTITCFTFPGPLVESEGGRKVVSPVPWGTHYLLL